MIARRRQAPEEQLQMATVKFLRHALDANAMFFAVPNGGLRSRTEAMRFKATGTIAGMPDLFVIFSGKTLGIELKAPKGRLSDAQINCHAKLMSAGVRVGVCRSLEEVVSELLMAGVPLRAKVLA